MPGQGGTTVEARRRIAVSDQPGYRWREGHGGLKMDRARRMKDLQKDNLRPRPAISDLTLDKPICRRRRRRCIDQVKEGLEEFEAGVATLAPGVREWAGIIGEIAMWVRAAVPDFGPDGRATVARIHAREGDRLVPGGLLIDLDVDLSGGIARDCPPVSTCRIVLREALWLRRLHVRAGAALAPGAPLADFADTPDAPHEPPARAARIATVAVVHHPDWWGAEG